MMLLRVSSSFMLTILLLVFSYKTHSAPTHHLTIGVQGNTPTLIVTSSEIDMTLQTKDASKDIETAEYTTKSNPLKKSLKTKLNKTNPLLTKKDKLQYLAKPLTKQTLTEETSFNVMKSLKNKENILKQPITSTLKMDASRITSTTQAAPITTGNVEFYKSNLQFTTTPTKLINNIQSSTVTSQINTIEPDVMTTLPPQATTDFSSTPLTNSDDDNDDSVNIPPAKSITLNPKESDYIATSMNYNADKTVVLISNAVTQMQTKTIANDFVLQTQNITTILPDTSFSRTENEDDSNGYTQEAISTTENENLLLTTIETKPFTTHATSTTPAAISTPPLVTLLTDNTEPTTTTSELTMTTTTAEKLVDDNNTRNNKNEQQQPATVHLQQSIYGPTKESYKVESDKDMDHDVMFNPRNDYMSTKIATQHSYESPLKSTENPLQDKNMESTQESVLNAMEKKLPKNQIKTTAETETIPTTLLTVTEEQTFATLKTMQTHKEITTIPTDQAEETSTTTTERVLKLIDLEKHVLKAIDELKQPSLLMAGQHDNGHDGLKSIKKKQLIDKHYVEALLHNKQDVPSKDSLEYNKYLTETTQSRDKSTSFTPDSIHTTAASYKPMLTPIKHGYLGPILMEEKTFHVIHHADNNMTARNHHVDGIENQLRKGIFVELKAKKEVNVNIGEEQINTNQNKNESTESSSMQRKKILEMQSDQPVQISNKQNVETFYPNKRISNSAKTAAKAKDIKQVFEKKVDIPARIPVLERKQKKSSTTISTENKSKQIIDIKHNFEHQDVKELPTPKTTDLLQVSNPEIEENTAESTTNYPLTEASPSKLYSSSSERHHKTEPLTKPTTVLSTTVFQVNDSVATKTPMVQADTLFTSVDKEKSITEDDGGKQQTESKISDIQIEIYDSTVDSIVASTNFKDIESKYQSLQTQNDESLMGKTTKRPIATIQQERFTQYVIDRTETSTHEPINFTTIQVASGKPEPAAIEIHINVSESFGNESEDLEFSYPQTEYSDSNNNERILEESYDNNKGNENIKLKIPSNSNVNGKELRNDEILVVEIIDTDNKTDSSFNKKTKNSDELFITDLKDIYSTPPPPPPPPPYQSNFDRDSDTIFYISNTEVKVGESLPSAKNSNEERKLKLESQFFPANYMASTHPNMKNAEDANPTHHLYEEDIILSSRNNQADSLKIYRNNNEPSPPLDVTYVGESIIEVEQSPESVITTTYGPDQQHFVATPQPDVIIQPAILPEISIGVPVIGELPPQIELKEIDFMPSEAQFHRSGIYYDNDNSNSNSNSNNNNNNFFNNDIDENTINASNNNHDVDVVSGNSNNNQRVDESSIQYGGDLIDESADGGFDGVEGSYPFGNPASVGKSSSSSYSSAFLTKLRKQQQQQQQQPNHVADYAHLYVNYGVNNMRKDELSADVKDSGEIFLVSSGGNGNGNGNINVASNEQNITSFKDFLNKVSVSNSTIPFMSVNASQSERMSNATAFSVMEDINDLEEKNTEDIINLISLAIGLFIVILPVVVTCSMFWALRYLYKKYHSTITDNGGYTDQTDTKSALNEDGMEKGEDISRVARETKMDYNKDGVFVVEVARGIDSKTIPESPVTDGNEKKLLMFDTKKNNGSLGYKITNENNCVNNEKVQIHSPPAENQEEGPRSLHQIEEVEEPTNSPHLNENNDEIVGIAYKGNTGLSQSDLSSTSSSDSNKDYCYGNQQLYVVEQNLHSTAASNSNGNVYLKHDIKDIKDDDRNPENDQYLKHSPDKREELSKDKKDIVESTEKSGEQGSRANSGESPEQKQNENVQEIVENTTITENIPELKEKEKLNSSNMEEESMREHKGEWPINIAQSDELAQTKTTFEISKNAQSFVIPVQIEVHITPAEEENATEETTLSTNKTEQTETSPVLQETQNLNQPLNLENISEVVQDYMAGNSLDEEQNNKIDQNKPETCLDNRTPEDDEKPSKIVEENEQCENIKQEDKENIFVENINTNEQEEIMNKSEIVHSKMELVNGLEANDILNTEKQEAEERQSNIVCENGLISNDSTSTKTEQLEFVEEETTLNIKPEVHDTELHNGKTQSELLLNSTTTLSDIVTEPKQQQLQNGHAEVENSSSSLNETENGFDSIMSLPEPPPTTDEQLNSDLSYQQLDSLPPPPPPETFNLKDLPPPLSNGNKDSPQSEESTSFYNTLPPLPPTTLKVTVSPEMTRAANGKVHASPLTPPASPPAHFTNNLHAGLCSQPIAVDVNGS